MAKEGILLINLGTPDDTSTASVRRYLRQFLSDPRVIDINPVGRFMLLNLFILPFRPKKSAEAYQEIWTEEGSPLKIHTEALSDVVTKRFPTASVRYAMRYQNPSIESALKAFREEGVERLVVVPLYPQYASSSTGSCLEELYRLCADDWNTPHLIVVPPFYDHPAYLKAFEHIIREKLGNLDDYDMLLMSFHGLPERQVMKCDTSGNHCLKRDDCCDAITTANRYCYRAQSYATARGLAELLGLSEDQYEVAFQSRLGRTPWIKPYTDEVIEELPKRGVKKLAVTIPSFTADCLETLEEIDMRAREDFLNAGGEKFEMVPSLNSEEIWVDAVCQMIREQGVVMSEEA